VREKPANVNHIDKTYQLHNSIDFSDIDFSDIDFSDIDFSDIDFIYDNLKAIDNYYEDLS